MELGLRKATGDLPDGKGAAGLCAEVAHRPAGAEAGAAAGGASCLRRRAWYAAMALVLAGGIGLRLANVSNVVKRTPDEITYVGQASRVLTEGGDGLRSLAAEYRSTPARQLYPLPSRAGYLWLAAATMKLTGAADARAGVYLSCAASIGSLILLAAIGVRFFPPVAALLALVLFAVSPAELGLSRRVWGDALLGFLALAMILSAALVARSPGKWAARALFVGAGCIAMTVKETGLLVFGICVALLAWELGVVRKARREALGLLLLAGAGTAAAVSWLAHSVGGFGTLFSMMSNLPRANAANAYALEYQTGPWYLVLQGLFLVSPLATIAAAAGAVSLVAAQLRPSPARVPAATGDRRVITGIALTLGVLLALPMILDHWVNLRYLSPALGAFCLIAGLGVWCAANALRRRVPPRWQPALASAAAVVVLAGAALDLRFFERVILRADAQDLTVKILLAAREAGRKGRAAADGSAPQQAETGGHLSVLEGEAKRAPTPERLLNLSLAYHQAGRYAESIAACRGALRLRPDYAEAYNNIAAAYEALGLWDEAVEAAVEALRLKPEFPLARNNLEYAKEQKRLKAAGDAPVR